MNASSTPSLYLALIHHPVVNRKKEIITAAVTTLDLHDIARAARTFGVKAFYVVTPLIDQQRLCRRLLRHWRTGWGARFNPDRAEAFRRLRIQDSLDAVKREIEAREGKRPRTVATGARMDPLGKAKQIRFKDLERRLLVQAPWLFLFGTAWGLAPSVAAEADHVLEPIRGPEAYNHLSVRSAVAIVLDRLQGRYGR